MPLPTRLAFLNPRRIPQKEKVLWSGRQAQIKATRDVRNISPIVGGLMLMFVVFREQVLDEHLLQNLHHRMAEHCRVAR
jgi:hypothetical protein